MPRILAVLSLMVLIAGCGAWDGPRVSSPGMDRSPGNYAVGFTFSQDDEDVRKPESSPFRSGVGENPATVSSLVLAQTDTGAEDDGLAGDYDELGDDDLDFLDDEDLDGSTRTAASVPDPFSPFNRAMFQFNDRMYWWVLKPVATGYKEVVPTPARSGIRNFFDNLAAPLRFVNCLFQGKVDAAEQEMARFLLNSSVGGGGVLDPADKHEDLVGRDEDFGQTMGYHGVDTGPYVVWPLFGPSSVRGTVGGICDILTAPEAWLTPWWISGSMDVLERVNSTSFNLEAYDSLVEISLDPYEAVKNAYLQNRISKVRE